MKRVFRYSAVGIIALAATLVSTVPAQAQSWGQRYGGDQRMAVQQSPRAYERNDRRYDDRRYEFRDFDREGRRDFDRRSDGWENNRNDRPEYRRDSDRRYRDEGRR